MKFTVAKLYELGALEGTASYSDEFFSKLRELSEDSNSPVSLLFWSCAHVLINVFIT